MKPSFITKKAEQRAFLATLLFTIVFIVGAYTTITDWQQALPLVIFQAAVIYHAYYSIRCFSSIIPPNNQHQLYIDAVLTALYILLPFYFNSATCFVLVSAIMLAVAALKYAAILDHIPYPKTLRRKIIADVLGALLCLLALAAILEGYETLATTAWVVIMALATIYYMAIRPLYVVMDK